MRPRGSAREDAIVHADDRWFKKHGVFYAQSTEVAHRLTGPVAEAPDVGLCRTARSRARPRHQAKPGVPLCS